MFLNPSARSFIEDWEGRARRLLAEFRADIVARMQEPETVGLVDQLRDGSEAFGRWWDEQQVMNRHGGERTFNRPDGGILRFYQLTAVPTSDADFKIVVLLEPTEKRRCLLPSARTMSPP